MSRRPRRPSLVILSRGDLFPPRHGSAVKITRLAAALSHQAEVHLVTDEPARFFVFHRGHMAAREYPEHVRARARPAADAFDRVSARGVPRGEAFLFRPLFDPSFLVRLAFVAAESGARVFLAEQFPFIAPCLTVARAVKGRVIVSEHNVEFERLAEQYPGLPPRTRRWLRRTEVALCNAAHAVVACSPVDRHRLAAAGVSPRKLRVVPHGVDLAAYRRRRRAGVRRYGEPASGARLVFHGIYRYPPNLQAALDLGREILPRVRALGIDAEVIAIGADPPPGPHPPGLTFTGGVADLAGHLQHATVAVVPLRQAGGTRLKVLEYFAAGVPVVATRKAMEGLGAVPGREFLQADDWDGFAAAIARIVGEPALSRRLAAHGRAFVRDLDWRRIAERYLRVAGLAGRARRASARGVARAVRRPRA